MNLLRAAATVSSLTLLSRVTGLIRDLLISRVFGVSGATDAFNVAFRIPNLLRRLFAEGAFQQAFVPVLADTRAQRGDDGMRHLVDHVAATLFWTLLLVSLAGVVAAPALVWIIATGLAHDAQTFDLATKMTRWMFPYILCMSLVAFAAGALNTFKRFAVPALTPVVLNLSFIACALWLAPRMATPILALALAVVIGGVLQLALQVPALYRIGMLPRVGNPLTGLRDENVRRILRLMLPAIFAVSVAQLSIIINTNIASHLPTGSVTWLAFADRLMEFPTALLGVALGTVLLPSLSAAFAEQRSADYSRLLDWGLRLTLLLALPAAAGLGLLAEGLVGVLFQGGKFSWHDVQQTALALIGYAVGLIGLIAVKILAPGFYAQRDIKTPVKIAVSALIATQLANLAFVPWLGHAGLAFSVSLGACVNAALLFAGLWRRRIFVPQPGWGGFALRLALALGAMIAWLGWTRATIDWQAGQGLWATRAIQLAAVIAAAGAIYFAALWLLGFRPRDFVLRG
ncbi:MAG TPA: murein biosynthesis integral membrane protein MurJ [Burkholderiaceae bacterium]|nr:murein biosynthesis integral membrane protein MurJ [Burkholderiaceae bacterium]